MRGEVLEQRRRQAQARRPQPLTAEVGREQLRLAAARQRDPLPGAAAAMASVALAQLDHPALVAVVGPGAPRRRGERRGEVHAQAAEALKRSGEGRRGVDDEQVAGLEQFGEVEEARVAEAGARGHQQPHLVPFARRLNRRFERESTHAGATALAW